MSWFLVTLFAAGQLEIATLPDEATCRAQLAQQSMPTTLGYCVPKVEFTIWFACPTGSTQSGCTVLPPATCTIDGLKLTCK